MSYLPPREQIEVEVINSRDQRILVSLSDVHLVLRGFYIRTDGYVCITVDGQKKLMHRAVLGLTDPAIFSDHRNHIRSDNTRRNLRVATPKQNNHNLRRHKDNQSGYKGVSWSKDRGKWVAAICVNSKQTPLGRFESKEDAARAYDRAAQRHYGDFAVLNFGVGNV